MVFQIFEILKTLYSLNFSLENSCFSSFILSKIILVG